MEIKWLYLVLAILREERNVRETESNSLGGGDRDRDGDGDRERQKDRGIANYREKK